MTTKRKLVRGVVMGCVSAFMISAAFVSISETLLIGIFVVNISFWLGVSLIVSEKRFERVVSAITRYLH
jgi:hypothetical protein